MSATGLGATVRRRLLGLLLIATVMGFLAVTILKFEKVFEPVVMVSLRTDKIGNQLLRYSDVKVDGVRVGEVRQISATSDGAELKLAILPGKAKDIPANVKAVLLPKTLFGEKYVSIERPQDSSGQHLTDGDIIHQDHSKKAVETEKAVNDLMPVLQAVQPAKLSETLHAMATALRGRGKELGQNLRQLGEYLGKLNPHLPTIEHDLSDLATVAQNYSGAVPHLVNALNNFVTTSRTNVQQRAQLSNLYASMTTMARDNRGFLQANEHNIIHVASSGKPTLKVLARYAPEYPCLFHGLAATVPRTNKAFGKGTNKPGLHATIEVTVSRGPYKPGKDTPQYNENRGPRCYTNMNPIPTPAPQYPPDGPLKDGSSHPPASRSHSDGVIPAEGGARTATSPQSAPAPQAAPTSAALGLPNSRPEQHLIEALLSPHAGGDPSQIPGWASALFGPMFRGSEVNVR